jgi:hypothetical protein
MSRLKFLCLDCDQPMKLHSTEGPDDSLAVTPSGCGFRVAMLTNPFETQMVRLVVAVARCPRRSGICVDRWPARGPTRSRAQAESEAAGPAPPRRSATRQRPPEPSHLAWTAEAERG